jgi:hypothetical protein
MTDQKHIVSEVFQLMKQGADDLDVMLYLREKGIDPEEQEPIFESARLLILEDRMKYRPKRNKAIFFMWLGLSLLIFILGMAVLPYNSRVEFKFILSLLTTIAILFCAYMAFFYYKSWTPEFLKERETPKLSLALVPLLGVPAVIIYFIISWHFSSVAEKLLSKNMERATGTIIDGQSYSTRRLDFTEVTVKFTTKKGEVIVATKDISKYAFRNFYKGQRVELVYSTLDPRNLDLLTNESNVRSITGSEERYIYPKDLLQLLELKKEQIGPALDNICFGWTYNEKKVTWTNNRKNMMYSTAGDQSILIMQSNVAAVYPKYFKELGMMPANTNSKLPMFIGGVFENAQYRAEVRYKASDNGAGDGAYIVTLAKK